MRILLTALTTLMFAVAAAPAEALTLRDIGQSVSGSFKGAADWFSAWWWFHDCVFVGNCEIWDISIGFLALDGVIVWAVGMMIVEQFKR